MTAIIETKSLQKIYDDDTETIALQDISISIEKGEFVSIMGPSGSGKSTLLHILGLLERYSNGKYFFDGKEMSEYSEDELAHIRNEKIGFVFQSFNLLPHATVLENVKLPLLYSKISESKWDEMAKDAILKVQLTQRINHQAYQLSGGERQRVAIARALIVSPQIIFADEPTGNLDSKSGQVIMEIIQKLNEEQGHTIVLVTHETNTAEHAQRIINILDGKVDSEEKVLNRKHATDKLEK